MVNEKRCEEDVKDAKDAKDVKDVKDVKDEYLTVFCIK